MNENQQQNNIYDNLAKLGSHLTEMGTELAALKSQLNVARHLQEAIKKLRDQHGEQQLSTGRRTLNELYHQGFHVCRKHFGERLAPHESCIFCDEAIFSGMDEQSGRQE